MHIARTQFYRQAVAFPIEKQQRMVADGLEVAIVSATFLPAINRDLGAVHVQHHAVGRIDHLRLGDQIAADPRQTGEVFSLRQQFGLERLPA